MKKILVLAGRLPYPVDDGWKIRTFFLIRSLAQTGAELDLLVFGDPLEDCGELKDLCRNIHIIPRKKSYSPIDLFRGVYSKTPFTVLNYADDRFTAEFERLTTENDYDYVQVEDINLAQYALNKRGPKRVLDMHNIESDLLRRYADKEKSFFRSAYARLTASKLERYEMTAVSNFDGVLVCSGKEKRELEVKGAETPVQVVPNGVDCPFYSDIDPDSQEKAIVFVGSMDYHANISGIEFFASDVLPLIKKECPELKVYVVGKNPPDHIKSLSDDNFIVTGGVPNVRPYLEKGLLTIVPLLVGGGTRLKILESMAAGRAVVSTSLGAEGIEISHGDNILIADKAEDFAAEVLKLVSEPKMRNELRDRARDFVVGKYDWSSIGKNLQDFVGYLCGDYSDCLSGEG